VSSIPHNLSTFDADHLKPTLLPAMPHMDYRYRNPNPPNSIPRHDCISSTQYSCKALQRSKRHRLGRMYSGQISQDSKQSIMLTQSPGPRPPRHVKHSPTGPQSFITLFSPSRRSMELRNEALHVRDRAENSLFHWCHTQAKATRFTPTLSNDALDRLYSLTTTQS
jgi:hypothetical protein